MSVNKTIIIGNLGRDPEIKRFDSGAVNASFSVAVTEKYKDKSGEASEHTEWFNVVLWKGLVEVAEKYLKKGSQVYIEGRLRTREYETKDGEKRKITELMGDQLQMLGSRKEQSSEPGPIEQAMAEPASNKSAKERAMEKQRPVEAEEIQDLPF